jgi:glycosyltransferase involved in cell wall biosynthesis
VPRPAGSFALGEFGLDRRGRETARRLLRSYPGTRVVVNGGNCQWPDINWVHYVHSAWTGIDPAAPAWFKVKQRLFGARWRRAERRVIPTARIVIANSELTQGHLIDRLGVPADRVHTIYLGSDPGWTTPSRAERTAAREWLGIHDMRPLVAFVGALGRDKRKGFDTLWSAWTQLCREADWDATLVIAGAGSEGDTLQAAAREAGLADRIRVIGYTDRIRDLLGAVDLLVSPARYESYGLNVQEALCRGVPAIVSRGAGVAERYTADVDDMLLDHPDDVRALVRKMRAWRRNVDGWRARVAPLGRSLAGYSWNDMASRFVEAATVGAVRQSVMKARAS